jgi:hypothetical protein
MILLYKQPLMLSDKETTKRSHERSGEKLFRQRQTTGADRISNAGEKFPDRSLHHFGNPYQSLNRNDFFTAFDLTNIFGVQIHGFCQSFLGKTGTFTIQANRLSDGLPVPQYRLLLFL